MNPKIMAAIGLMLLMPASARAIEKVDWDFGPKQQVDKPAPPGG